MKQRLLQKYTQWGYQGGRCCWCLDMIPEVCPIGRREEYERYNLPTWEHIVPQSKGGKDEQSNLVLAHYRCNKERGTKFGIPQFSSYTVINETEPV